MNGKRRLQMFDVIAALLKRCLTFHVIKTCWKRVLTLFFVLEALYPLITLILIQILHSYSSPERCGGAGALLRWSWRRRGAQNTSTGELPGLKMPPRDLPFRGRNRRTRPCTCACACACACSRRFST